MNEESSKTTFDFNSVTDLTSTNLDKYLEEKEKAIKQQMLPNKSQRKENSFAWLFVFALLISLIGLGTLTLSESRKNKELLSELENKSQVLGTSDEKKEVTNPISGYGFSILPDTTPPQDFEMSRKTQDSQLMKDRSEVVTDYLASFNREGSEQLSGVSITVLEYDNRFNQEQLSSQLVTYLGSDYEIKAKDILIPRNLKVWKIEKKGRTENISYFTLVTTENYYIIKVYNETSKYPELSEISKFTDTILQKLYLN
jgi:hypothetical protein